MNKELINQAKILFDKPEKWNAFLDLISIKDSIIKLWYDILDENIKKRFEEVDKVKDWSYQYYSARKHVWFLEKFSTSSPDEDEGQSLCLWLELDDLKWQFSLYVNDKYFNYKEIDTLLKSQDYQVLLDAFVKDVNNIGKEEPNGGYRITEYLNKFNFNSNFAGEFDFEHLAWFAGNKPEELVDQIAKKVNRFRKEPLTKLLYDLNEKTKR